DHYVEIGMAGVRDVVDAVGGVELCLDYDVDDWRSDLVWEAGCHPADGQTALAFARMRYADPEGDIGRTARQRQIVSAIISEVTTPATLLDPRGHVELIDSGLSAIVADEDTGIIDLGRMALAFRSATGNDGLIGTPPIADYDCRPSRSRAKKSGARRPAHGRRLRVAGPAGTGRAGPVGRSPPSPPRARTDDGAVTTSPTLDLDPTVTDAADVARRLGVDPATGLSSEEAARRLATDGPNELRSAPPVPLWRRVLAQFQDPLVYLLLVAVGISLVAWLVEGPDGAPVDAIV